MITRHVTEPIDVVCESAKKVNIAMETPLYHRPSACRHATVDIEWRGGALGGYGINAVRPCTMVVYGFAIYNVRKHLYVKYHWRTHTCIEVISLPKELSTYLCEFIMYTKAIIMHAIMYWNAMLVKICHLKNMLHGMKNGQEHIYMYGHVTVCYNLFCQRI
jgi:hypothetical protein